MRLELLVSNIRKEPVCLVIGDELEKVRLHCDAYFVLWRETQVAEDDDRHRDRDRERDGLLGAHKLQRCTQLGVLQASCGSLL